MRPIFTDGVAWCVCLSVGLLQSWALQKQLHRSYAVWGVDSGWPKEPHIRWGFRSPMQREMLTAKTSAWQMASWRSNVNYSSATEPELWRNWTKCISVVVEKWQNMMYTAGWRGAREKWASKWISDDGSGGLLSHYCNVELHVCLVSVCSSCIKETSIYWPVD